MYALVQKVYIAHLESLLPGGCITMQVASNGVQVKREKEDSHFIVSPQLVRNSEGEEDMCLCA